MIQARLLEFFLKKEAQEIIGLGSPLDKASLQVISSITAPHFSMAGSGYPIEQECSHSLLPSVLTPASDLLQHLLQSTTKDPTTTGMSLMDSQYNNSNCCHIFTVLTFVI